MSRRSRRSGWELTSMIVRVSTAFAITASMSSGCGSRRPIRRPVGWPRMSTCGFSSAAQIRLVWSATTAGATHARSPRPRRARRGARRSSRASRRAGCRPRAGQQDEVGRELLGQRPHRSICSRRRPASRPIPKPTAGEWSVMLSSRSPGSRAAATIASSVALPSLQSVCECRSPRIWDASTSSGSAPFLAASISPRFSRSSGGTQSIPSRRRPRPRRRSQQLAGLDHLDAVLADLEAGPHGLLPDRHVVILRAGKMLEQVSVTLSAHDPQLDTGCRRRRRRRSGGALRLDGRHPVAGDESLGDGLGSVADTTRSMSLAVSV